MVEVIYGCKWSLTVYQLLVCGIIERIAYNEIPPRVEYMVTPFGTTFIRILDELEKLQGEIASEI